MKRYLTLFFVFIMILTFCACGNTEDSASNSSSKSSMNATLAGGEKSENENVNSWVLGGWKFDDFDGKFDSADEIGAPLSFIFTEDNVEVLYEDKSEKGTYEVVDIEEGEKKVICTFVSETIELFLSKGGYLAYPGNPYGAMLAYCASDYVENVENLDIKDDKPVLSSSEAKKLASDFAKNFDGVLEAAAKDYDGDINSVNRINVESVSVSKKNAYTDGPNYYEIIAKGSFTAKDDYGKSLGTYYFDWTLVIDYRAEGKKWISYHWADGTWKDDVKIHK